MTSHDRRNNFKRHQKYMDMKKTRLKTPKVKHCLSKKFHMMRARRHFCNWFLSSSIHHFFNVQPTCITTTNSTTKANDKHSGYNTINNIHNSMATPLRFSHSVFPCCLLTRTQPSTPNLQSNIRKHNTCKWKPLNETVVFWI